MPWVLLLAAAGIASYGLEIRHDRAVSSTVTTQAPGANGKLTTTKLMTTRSVPSDALIGMLLGVAVVLALCGAFYARVTKITLPGGAGLELGAADPTAVGNAVGEAVKRQIAKDPKTAEQASSPEAVVELAAKTATATAVAQQQATAISQAVVPAARAGVPGVPRGMPLSDELLAQLAENAVKEVFEL
jgi:hypothetical protein